MRVRYILWYRTAAFSAPVKYTLSMDKDWRLGWFPYNFLGTTYRFINTRDEFEQYYLEWKVSK